MTSTCKPCACSAATRKSSPYIGYPNDHFPTPKGPDKVRIEPAGWNRNARSDVLANLRSHWRASECTTVHSQYHPEASSEV